MQTWIKQTRKRVRCFYCGDFIEVNEFQVVCTYLMPLHKSSRVWTKAMHFHAKKPYCWVDRAIVELKKKPYSERRGRKADVISDVNRVLRQKILRRRASYMQRVSREMMNEDGTNGRQRPSVLHHLGERIYALRAEIEPYGGIPESW